LPTQQQKKMTQPTTKTGSPSRGEAFSWTRAAPSGSPSRARRATRGASSFRPAPWIDELLSREGSNLSSLTLIPLRILFSSLGSAEKGFAPTSLREAKRGDSIGLPKMQNR
jgi:hypothetical protein